MYVGLGEGAGRAQLGEVLHAVQARSGHTRCGEPFVEFGGVESASVLGDDRYALCTPGEVGSLIAARLPRGGPA